MSEILPGATLGIIGGGQLARMMILEARRMGYRAAVLADDPLAPAVSLANHWIEGTLDDVEAAERLAEVSDVITLDTEHVPATLLSHIEPLTLVRPSSAVLRNIQDRSVQRTFLDRVKAGQPRWEPVTSREMLDEKVSLVGFPCVLKSSHAGYDGKGQAVLRNEADLDAAWATAGGGPAILEEFVHFDCEVSVLLARNPSGEVRFYPLARNVHRNHVLHTTEAPAPVEPQVDLDAFDVAARIANALDHIGMMAVEMYLVDGRRLLVNEIAPRPHNSGHYTFGGCVTSQFEQHVRAVFGLPLGNPSLPLPAAMINLFGDLWQDGEPDWSEVFAHPEARLHLYDKAEPRPGRKMGHILVLNEDLSSALETGESILSRLQARPVPAGREEIAHPS